MCAGVFVNKVQGENEPSYCEYVKFHTCNHWVAYGWSCMSKINIAQWIRTMCSDTYILDLW